MPSPADLKHAVHNILALNSALNARSVNHYGKSAGALRLQQQLYELQSHDYLTFQCYESRKSALPGGSDCLVVPKPSGYCASAPNWHELELPADHLEICQFSYMFDESFKVLLGPLKFLVETARNRYALRWRLGNGA
jgi:hypothetical protein